MEAQISNFGQTPSQLFRKPHPQRAARRPQVGETHDASPPLSLQILPPQQGMAGGGGHQNNPLPANNGGSGIGRAVTRTVVQRGTQGVNALVIADSGNEVLVFAQGQIASITFNQRYVCMCVSMHGWMHVCMYACMDVWMYGCMEVVHGTME